MTDLQYENIITTLSELKTDMKSIVGNGRPGRLDTLEAKVFWIIVYGVAVAVLVLGPAAFALLKP